MREKNICYFVNCLVNGGIEAVLYNYLSRTNLENYKIIFITTGDSNNQCIEKFEKLGARVYRIPNRKRIFKHIKCMANIIKKEKINIIHSHLGFHSFLPSLVGLICGVKIRISHSHVFKSEKKSVKENFETFFNKIFSNFYMACGLKAGEYVFGKSKKVLILKNSIDTSNYIFDEKIRNKKRKELKLNDKHIYANVGRFAKQKNQLFLIDVFYDISLNDSNSHLLIVGGDGNQYDLVVDKINKLNLQNKVTLLKNRTDVNELYQAMDILLLPSFDEGFPLVALEAETSNLPIIFSDKITREVEINDNVYFLPIDDYKKWSVKSVLVVNENSRSKVKNNMIESGFNLNNSYKDLDNYYQSFLNKKYK